MPKARSGGDILCICTDISKCCAMVPVGLRAHSSLRNHGQFVHWQRNTLHRLLTLHDMHAPASTPACQKGYVCKKQLLFNPCEIHITGALKEYYLLLLFHSPIVLSRCNLIICMKSRFPDLKFNSRTRHML